MYCRKCGKAIPDDSVFCSYCGYETGLSASAAEKGKGISKKRLLNPVAITAFTVILAAAALICVFLIRKETPVEDSASDAASSVSSQEFSTIETLSEEERDPKYMQWQKFETLEDGIAATGIDLAIPELLDGFDITCIANKGKRGIQAWEARLVSSNVEEILIIKTVGSGNNNVNDYAYNEEIVMDVGGNDITIRLQDGNVSLAYWNVGEYAYSLMFRGFAADLDTAIEMINQIK